MKKHTLLTALLLLSACTTVKSYQPAPQSYRAANSEKLINITGELKQKLTEGFASD